MSGPREHGPALTALREIARDTAAGWSEHNIPMRAAAMSYYFLVTLAPLALVVLYLAARIVGASKPGEVLQGFDTSARTGAALDQIISVSATYAREMGTGGPLLAAGIALVGATVLLGEFTATLDFIWDSAPEGHGLRYFVRRRLLGAAGLLVIIALGFVTALFVGVLGLIADTVGEAAGVSLTLPPPFSWLLDPGWWSGLVFVAVLLSIAFTWLPRRRIRWRDVLPGVALTAVAYVVGQRVLGIYVRGSAVVTAWGAIGTFVALVVWIFYTMQVVLAGAELTRVLVLRAEHRRGAAVPEADREAGSGI